MTGLQQIWLLVVLATTIILLVDNLMSFQTYVFSFVLSFFLLLKLTAGLSISGQEALSSQPDFSQASHLAMLDVDVDTREHQSQLDNLPCCIAVPRGTTSSPVWA